MNNCWLIAPFKNEEPNFTLIWNRDKTKGVISIGWNLIGDPSCLTKENLSASMRKNYPNYDEGKVTEFTNLFLNFYQNANIGDLVLARKGINEIIGLGVISDYPYYDFEASKIQGLIGNSFHPNFLPVKWMDFSGLRTSDFLSDDLKLTQHTFRKIDESITIKSLPAELYSKLKIFQAIFNTQNINSLSGINDIDSSANESLFVDRAKSVVWNFKRNPEVRRQVIVKANGQCEMCNNHTFKTTKDQYFLEAHHIISLSKQGPDNIENVIALCPNHHREAHYGIDGEKLEEDFKIIIKKSTWRSE